MIFRALICFSLLSYTSMAQAENAAPSKPEEPAQQSTSKPYMDDSNILIGTGSITGVYYPAGGAICRMLNREREKYGIRCAVESTPGSIYNIRELRKSEIDFGISQSDWLEPAFNGTDIFEKDGAFQKLRFVFSLHGEAFTMIVKRNSGIEKLDDIQNKVVNIGFPGSGVRGTMEVLMKIKGWTNKSFKSTAELRPEEEASALCEGKIDVMVIATGHPNGIVQDAIMKCSTKIIPIEDPAINDFITTNKAYEQVVIPGGMYPGMPSDTKTIGVKAVLLATTDTSDDVVYKLTKAVFDNLDSFKKLHPVFFGLNKDDMAKEAQSIAIHPGAAKYYKEIGLSFE